MALEAGSGEWGRSHESMAQGAGLLEPQAAGAGLVAPSRLMCSAQGRAGLLRVVLGGGSCSGCGGVGLAAAMAIPAPLAASRVAARRRPLTASCTPLPPAEPSTSYPPAAVEGAQRQRHAPFRWPWQQPAAGSSSSIGSGTQRQPLHALSSSGGRRVAIPRDQLPLDLLLVPRRAPPPHALPSDASARRANRDAGWAQKREALLAAAAAGFHVALFAYNLAFWGFEGQAPGRCARVSVCVAERLIWCLCRICSCAAPVLHCRL